MVMCSRCGELIKTGWDYRWHFDQHMDEFDSADDKQEYIKRTMDIMNGKLSKIINNKQ